MRHVIGACRRLTSRAQSLPRHWLLANLLVVMFVGIGLPGAMTSSAQAKTPGKTYCFKGTCHRVKTISETRREIGRRRIVYASHYDHCRRDKFNPCGLTSSGERFRPDSPDNAASPIYPDGTRLLVWNPSNGNAAVVRINNAGPYWRRRKLDLSRAAAEKLGFRHRGVAKLHIKVLSAPTRAEARYRRNRRYDPVPGFVGAFQSIDTALLSVGRAITGLFGSPVHAVAGRPSPSARNRRLAKLEIRRQRRMDRRLIAGVQRRWRRSAGSPPLPVSKRVALLQPLYQVANIEQELHSQVFGVQIALPSRPPMPPIPVASIFRQERRLKSIAIAQAKLRLKILRATTKQRREYVKRQLRSRQTRLTASSQRTSAKLARLARLPAAGRKTVRKATQRLTLARANGANKRRVKKRRVAALSPSLKTVRRQQRARVRTDRKRKKSISSRSAGVKAKQLETPRAARRSRSKTKLRAQANSRRKSKLARVNRKIKLRKSKSTAPVRRVKLAAWKVAVARGSRE